MNLNNQQKEAILSLSSLESPQQIPINQSISQSDTIHHTWQFLSLWNNLASKLDKLHLSPYSTHVSSLNHYSQICINLLNGIINIENQSHQMNSAYNQVHIATLAVQQACEKLLSQQENLLKLSDSISEKLSHFDKLEFIARQISSPGNIVTSNNFSNILSQLDSCLQFCEANPSYIDSPFYIQRFKQLLTRCMQLIKMHYVGEMRSFQHDLIEKKDISVTQWEIKFLSLIKQLKSIIHELEIRAPISKEYLGLLKECFSAYQAVRLHLYMPIVQNLVKETCTPSTPSTPTSPPSITQILNTAYPSIQGLLKNEVKLWYIAFDTGSSSLKPFLKSLATPLSTNLKPILSKTSQMETLSTFIKSIYEYLGGYDLHHSNQIGEKEEDVDALHDVLKDILTMAQTRLIFVAQGYMKNEIDNLKNWIMDRDVVDWLRQAKNLSMSKRSSLSLQSLGSGEFLPTVARTLMLLRALGGTLPPIVWSEMSGEALELAQRSVITVSQHHLKRHGPTSLRNSLGFVIKNLLELRRGIQESGVVPYLIEYENHYSNVPELPFPSMLKNLTSPLVKQGNGTPLQNLDDGIKKYCEDWINDVVNDVVGILNSTIVKINASTLSKSNLDLNDIVGMAEDEFGKNLERLDGIFGDLWYHMIDVDSDAFSLLIRLVKVRILDTYTRFCDVSGRNKRESFVDKVEKAGLGFQIGKIGQEEMVASPI